MKNVQYIFNITTTETQRLEAFRILMKTFVFLLRGAAKSGVDLKLAPADLVVWPNDHKRIVDERRLILSAKNKAIRILDGVQKRFEQELDKAGIGFTKEVVV
jgi:hypothetical protein